MECKTKYRANCEQSVSKRRDEWKFEGQTAILKMNFAEVQGAMDIAGIQGVILQGCGG